MGAWGYRPRDNDTSCDAVGTAMDLATRAVTAELGVAEARRAPLHWVRDDTWSKWEKIGAVEGLLHRSASVSHRVLRVCLKYLKQIQRDDAWIDQWREPDLTQRSIAAYIAFLEGLFQAEKERRAKLKKAKPRRSSGVLRRRFMLGGSIEYGWRDWPMLHPALRMIPAHEALYQAFTKEMKSIERAATRRRCAVRKRRSGGTVKAKRIRKSLGLS